MRVAHSAQMIFNRIPEKAGNELTFCCIQSHCVPDTGQFEPAGRRELAARKHGPPVQSGEARNQPRGHGSAGAELKGDPELKGHDVS